MSTSSAPRTLLVATDGSPPARLATVVAARIAASSDAELTVLHVAAPTRYRVARMALPIPVTRRLDDPRSPDPFATAPARATAYAGAALGRAAARMDQLLMLLDGRLRLLRDVSGKAAGGLMVQVDSDARPHSSAPPVSSEGSLASSPSPEGRQPSPT